MRTLNKQEANLLVYLESRAVDYAGVVDTSRMTPEEKDLATKWNDEGLIWYGEKKDRSFKRGFNHWVVLTNEAWALAAADRMRCAVNNHQKDKAMPEAAVKAISDAK